MQVDLFPPYFDGTLREHYLLLFGSAGAIALVVGSVSAWLGAWLGGRRALAKALREAPHREARLADDGLTQLAESIDLIGLEVERIAEAQRFTARLLSERQTVPPPRRDQGVITPH